MSSDLMIGLVGAGAIAQAHADSFRTVDGVRLVGVADVRPSAAQALAEPFGCTAVESYEALADLGVKAVVVATPPSSHVDVCRYFLERKVAVLCEKPLSIDVPSAESLVSLARSKDTVFTMASKFRFVDDVVRTKSLLASGVLGDIILCENAFTSHVDMTQRWNADPDISGGGVLIDNGTHSVDVVRYLFGPIVEVQAVEGRRVQSISVEDTVQLFVRTASGIMATIDLSWSINKELDHYINVHGSGGTVRVGWKESRYRQSGGRDWVVFGSGYDKRTAFRGQLENFRDAIRREAPLRITDDDAVASVRVIDAAYRSLRNTAWEKVERPAA